jgi:beta-lactam-binding protein with PASTA domain
VIAQSPRPGMRKPVGTKVKLVVSKGAKGIPRASRVSAR